MKADQAAPAQASLAALPGQAEVREARRRLLAQRRAHWRRTRALTGALLLLWFCTTFGTVFFARELAAVSVFGWTLSFYMAAQGASLIYLAILGAYALAMRRLDRHFAALCRAPAAPPAPPAPPAPHPGSAAACLPDSRN